VTATTLLVIAKQPVPGRVKTRLVPHSRFAAQVRELRTVVLGETA
jgi:glycosyltransferase A (GT-A) superfamily protein (DUF2064 family)